MHEDTRGADRFSVDLSAATHFAWLRTRLAAERTYMAYARTAVSLIGFGFTIYQFLARLGDDKTLNRPFHVNAPQWLGMLLILTGVVFLGVGMWNYRSFVDYLFVSPFKPIAGQEGRWHTGTSLITALLMIAGVFAFVSVLLRLR